MQPDKRFVRWIVFAVSIWTVGIGVALMVRAELGVSPNDVTNTGVAHVSGWSVGVGSWCTSAVAMVIAWIMGRRPLIPTVLGGLIVGVSINATMSVVPSVELLGVRIAMITAALILLWAAITGVVAAGVGAGPLELIMLALIDRGLSVRVARWGIELALLGIGLALGGEAGIGTILFATLTGPVLAKTLPPASKALGTHLSRVDQEAAASSSYA